MQTALQSINKVTMISPDSFSKRNNIVSCNHVKIEGDCIELDILMDATNLLENYKSFFIVETNSDKRIIDFFHQHEHQIFGYGVKPIPLWRTAFFTYFLYHKY